MAGMDTDKLKRQAAQRAVSYVESGMVLGLGHGSTAMYAVKALADLLRSGTLRDIVAVTCSNQVEAAARELGIPLTNLEDHPQLDLTIDGADEVDPCLDLIKGGGGALLREKIVSQVSRRNIVIVDETKLSSFLGTRSEVPVEVVPFGWRTQASFLESLGARTTLRPAGGGKAFLTEHGNLILDCHFGPISEPVQLAARLDARAGIVEHGLFLDSATDVIVATTAGIRYLEREPSGPTPGAKGRECH